MRITPDHLRAVARSILLSLGTTPEESDLIAESLVKAEMRGIPTHGVNFLPMLAERIEHGLVRIPTHLEIITDEDAVCHIDGGNGLGQTAADLAMRKAIEKASRFGIGTALVRNTNHIGLLGFYTMKAAAEGMVGICMSNSAPSIAPWGGREPFFGTNPISVAAPCENGQPVVLDMSTSVVARGKIRRAVRQGEPIPADWALDEDGRPTTDPSKAMKGTLMPIGGPKGYGLAFFVDLISGLLSGSRFSREVSTFHKPISPTGVGVAMIAIDIRRFMPLETFLDLIGAHVTAIRNSPPIEKGGQIRISGEIEAENEIRALDEGIKLDPQIQAALEKMISERGLDVTLSGSELSPGANSSGTDSSD